jgi:hypothetical protein
MQARFIEHSVTHSMPLVTTDRRTPQRAPRDEEMPPLQQSIRPTQPIQSEAMPPVDWHASGEQSVDAAVASIIRDESYRPLGPQEKRSYELPPVPSLFREPKHKFGDVDEDPMGRTAVWHSERCYTTLEEPITPRASADIPGVNPMKCLWLRKKPRGDLFDHLRRDAR